MSKKKSIIFNAEMVKAILEDRKTQTRRIIKLPDNINWELIYTSKDKENFIFRDEYRVHSDEYLCCPFGKVGDRLPVLESNAPINQPSSPSATTLFIEIIDIRVERVQDISLYDVVEEGIPDASLAIDFVRTFRMLWNSIYGKDAWNRNDWVWVIEFKKIKE